MVSSEFIADYLVSTVGLKLLLLIISMQVGSELPDFIFAKRFE